MKPKMLSVVVTLACGVALFGAVAYNGSQMQAQAKVSAPKQQPVYPAIEVKRVQPSQYASSVEGYGEAMPQYQLTLAAQISGQVMQLTPEFATGNRVKQGQLLARIEDSSYQQQVSDAQKAVADAKLALLEEQRQGEQAKQEWRRSGLEGEPDSPLVLRQPQLEAAQAALEQAQRQLASAKVDLSNTEIRAPFDAVIVSRDIQPGTYLQQGGGVATLYSTEVMEVRIPLSEQQWFALGQFQLGKQNHVTLTSGDGHRHWQGYAARMEQHLSSDDRQRALIVAVDKPLEQSQPLHPGSFVTATIAGAKQSGLWQLPATAISQDNTLWLVNEQNSITPFAAQKVFEDAQWVYVKPVPEHELAQVVLRPLNHYLSGMIINPVEEHRL